VGFRGCLEGVPGLEESLLSVEGVREVERGCSSVVEEMPWARGRENRTDFFLVLPLRRGPSEVPSALVVESGSCGGLEWAFVERS